MASQVTGSAPEPSAPAVGESPTLRARVITASNRAAAGVYPDRSGQILMAGLRELGFDTPQPQVVPDGDPVGVALAEAIAEQVDVVLTTGGTGLSPTDATPEQTLPLITTAVPGIAEAIRAYGIAQGVSAAMLSRGVSGLAGRTLVVNLPGSTGGCRDALEVLGPILRHVVEQVRSGAGHPQ